MMKNLKSADDGLRTPYKLLLVTALALPAANNLIFGWGMLFCEYFSMNSEFLGVLTRVLDVLFQVVRAAAFACTLMTIGFWAGKKGFTKALKPTFFAVLCGAGAAAVSLLICFLMILWGYTDASGVRTVWEKLLPYFAQVGLDLLILAVVEAVVAFFFGLVMSLKGRGGMLAARSPYMVTAYIVFAVYTVIMMIDVFSTVKTYYNEGRNFFVYCVLPFIYRLLYGGVMALAGSFFRRTLYWYFYEHDAAGNKISGVADAEKGRT